MPFNPIEALRAVPNDLRPYLRIGCHGGWWVRLLCDCLTAHDCPVRKRDNYDYDLKRAVECYQQRHGLVADGIVGRMTWSELAKEPPPEGSIPVPVKATDTQIQETIVKVARYIESLDIREGRRPNTGASVEFLLAFAKGSPGMPWCVAFVYCVTHFAYAILNKYPPEDMASLSCSALIRWAENRGLVVTEPQPGDLMVLVGGKTGYYHVCVVVGVNGRVITTVEGNTNDAGSPDGDGVYQRDRTGAAAVFIRVG